MLLPLCLLTASVSWGQKKADTITSDGLFQSARKAAFDRSDYPLAKRYLLKALRLSPDYADVRIFLGRLYTWTNSNDSARMAFRQVLTRQPDYEDAILAYADLELYAENYERALDITSKGLQGNPTSEPLMLQEAKVLNAMKRYAEAAVSINKLLRFNSANTAAKTLAARINANKLAEMQAPPVSSGKNTIDTSSADGLLAAARKAAFDSGNYPLAKRYLLKGLQGNPNYADLRIFLGRIHTWTRNYDSGRLAFQQVLATQPEYEDAVIAYTDLEYFSDNYERALALIKEGLRNNPASEALMLREAKTLNALKRFDNAERSVQKLLFLNSNNAEAKAMAEGFREAKTSTTNVLGAPVAGTEKINSDTTSSDGLLAAARKAAFDRKNYDEAKNYLYRALAVSPGYGDVKIFLGRLHIWTNNYDSARYYFRQVLKDNPGYEDAASAYSDMEYWNDNSQAALGIVDSALIYHPASVDLLIRKAKILSNLRRYAQADAAVQEVLRIDRNNSEARSLANRIKELATKNKIGLSYDYVSFDKQFSDPWHLVSFDYGRTTGIGSITGRVNYANRFKTNGVQYELEAYPRISNTFYTYVNAGYSENVGIFPQWRGGFSLYINLPKSYEADLGVRYLKFSGDPTWIYTGYLGKYYKSWLFGARAYITPSTFTNTVSASYTASARYYYGSADDMFGISAGYGISPDDRFNSIQIDSKVRLISYKAGLSFKKKVSKFTVISIDGTWFNQEYLPQTKGNQYQFSLGWLRRF